MALRTYVHLWEGPFLVITKVLVVSFPGAHVGRLESSVSVIAGAIEHVRTVVSRMTCSLIALSRRTKI